jgi:hypothetical protein
VSGRARAGRACRARGGPRRSCAPSAHRGRELAAPNHNPGCSLSNAREGARDAPRGRRERAAIVSALLPRTWAFSRGSPPRPFSAPGTGIHALLALSLPFSPRTPPPRSPTQTAQRALFIHATVARLRVSGNHAPRRPIEWSPIRPPTDHASLSNNQYVDSQQFAESFEGGDHRAT